MRESLLIFANDMEKELEENDHKGGWENSGMDYLTERLLVNIDHLDELFKTFFLKIEDYGSLIDCQRKNLIDIANYCMMIYDNLRNK